ncbi:putative RNA-dependent RNA polymerase 3-like isoform X2 [Hibiscus syriacus]|uniref:RNA-dependent RNA polymerase n=1 Tax=Hibiscus syriacus TaxID=106335 RepID=A0A6A3BP68_HIBSY|nr:probable RNA-dependent RNA polymerase 5 [Hibiscus syriacus]KAE8718810.1 putative RNA-dependent RNA polymerase 3-like isoform X2 [Hibiscus syriacus]
MENSSNEDVVLPPSVEALISRICDEQKQQPLPNSTKQELAERGEEESLKLLKIIQRSRINTTFDRYLKFLMRNSNSPFPLNSSPFSSPDKSWRLMMSSPADLAGGTSDVASSSAPVTPIKSSSASAGRGEGFSPQLEALGELEFRKAFLILSYIGQNRLEQVITAEEIRSYKNLAMGLFEKKVWGSLGQLYAAADRVKQLEWGSDKTYEYQCHVCENGSYRFKGPYFERTRSHLQRVLGDDNVLSVKFEKDGKSSVGSDFPEFKRIGKEGILVGLRRYRFFVFKDGGKAAKKKDPSTSSVKCFFVRFESNASIDQGKEYILSGKTVKEARSLFMHVHNLESMAKYMARFSLILSKTMKLDVDFDSLRFDEREDIPCTGEGFEKNGKDRIHTNGTGFISEDLALKCPKNVFKGSITNGANNEIRTIGASMGESPDTKSTESHRGVPPLLLQIRFFYNGRAIKGTLLVNKKLPPRTIQVRESMIKVRPDPSKNRTINSLELVTTSNKPKGTNLNRNLIMLLSHGGVPDDFFMDILKNGLEESERGFSNKRTALKVALNRGGMDELGVAKMILAGIPLDESYLQYRMSIMLNEDRKNLLEGKLPITGSYYLMGTVDPSKTLKRGEVSIILENGQISGKVLVYRAPGEHFGDVHVLNARYVDKLNEYVGHAKYAIFFPCDGPRSLADEMAGGDFDGDMFFVSQNPQLLDYFKASEPWEEECSTPEGPSPNPSKLSDEELESELFNSFLKARFQQSYAMSEAANSWIAIMDRFLTVKDPSERTLMKKNLESLINLYYEALDASKTGKKVVIPEDLIAPVFPHYMERYNSFKSTSIMGKIYDYVKSYQDQVSKRTKTEVRKLPCFDDGVLEEECREKWTALYEEYRKDMSDAQKFPSKEQIDAACNAVYDKYKKELYGGLELEERQRPMDEIRKEAVAIYNICYDYAMNIDEVGRCGFAWKVAGSALLNLYTEQLGESTLSCAPSVLKELFS